VRENHGRRPHRQEAERAHLRLPPCRHHVHRGGSIHRPGVPARRIGRSADVPTIRRSFALAAPVSKAIPILFTSGAALGILAIFTNGLNPFGPFLLIAYVMFVMATKPFS
jgi:hypothetical protein